MTGTTYFLRIETGASSTSRSTGNWRSLACLMPEIKSVGAPHAGTDPNLLREQNMPLGGLQHYTIEPSDLERTKDFYCDVLVWRTAIARGSISRALALFRRRGHVHLMGTRKPWRDIVVRAPRGNIRTLGALIISLCRTDVEGVRKRLQASNVKISREASCRAPAIRNFSLRFPTESAWS